MTKLIFKMRSFFFILIFSCFIFSHIQAQYLIKGYVLQYSSRAISYVNIGIKGKNKGAVSTEKGDFSLSLQDENMKDTLTFSCIGFEELSLPIQKIVKEKTSVFFLKEKISQLKEVVIISQKSKIKNIGTKSTNPFLWGSATSNDGKDVVEMGKFVGLKKMSKIQNLNVYLKGIDTDSASFRINFYDIKNEMPAERIIDKQIFCIKDLRKGWLEIDLTDFDLVFENDFVVAIEFLPKNDGNNYSFSYGGQMGGSTLIRTSSLGTWKKIKGASISMYLTIKQ